MTTIQDIADHAKVSKATVSRVLNRSSVVNPEKRDAVLEAMRTLGFQPNVFARSLAGGQSMTIGILTQNIGSPFYDTVAQGVIESLSGTGYSPIFVDGRWQQSTEMEVIRALLGRKVDGLVLIGGDVPLSELSQFSQQAPTVVVAREVPELESPCIFIDNFDVGYRATTHLIEMGHRKIAHIRGIEQQADAVQRFKGYQQALSDAGIQWDPQLVYQGDFSASSGVLAIDSFQARGKHFTAVFAANDMTAFGARLALHRKGIRVPDDVSIIGVDDQAESAFMTPPLTTIRQPAAAMGRAAAESLLKMIRGESCKSWKLTTELLMRESVARPR